VNKKKSHCHITVGLTNAETVRQTGQARSAV